MSLVITVPIFNEFDLMTSILWVTSYIVRTQNMPNKKCHALPTKIYIAKSQMNHQVYTFYIGNYMTMSQLHYVQIKLPTRIHIHW